VSRFIFGNLGFLESLGEKYHLDVALKGVWAFVHFVVIVVHGSSMHYFGCKLY
jgi:hypothetical protein